MKKIMFAIALTASVMTAYAQKNQESITKAIDKAVASSQDPKKAEKVATWMTLGKAYLDAYNAPQLNGRVGASAQELSIVMSEIKPLRTTQETVGNNSYNVQEYATCKYYINANGMLEMIVTTKPFAENALNKSLEAYAKAASVDPKGSKTKEITDAMRIISLNLKQEAINAYTFGDFKQSSIRFEESFSAAGTAPLSVIDTSSIYNAGFTAYAGKDWERAKKMFTESIKLGYTQNGDAYYKLADSYKQLGDTLTYKKTLEEGFLACPTSQAVLIGLINYYIESKDNPEKLFEILKIAQKNEPNNAALYYVEGNTYKQLGKLDEAIKAYDVCLTVNPDYEFGEIGKAQLYASEGDKYGEQAQNEMDDKKYQALLDKCSENYKQSIVYFEKAFNITKSENIKISIAQYLKALYFKFRNDSPEFMQSYEKYNKMLQEKARAAVAARGAN